MLLAYFKVYPQLAGRKRVPSLNSHQEHSKGSILVLTASLLELYRNECYPLTSVVLDKRSTFSGYQFHSRNLLR